MPGLHTLIILDSSKAEAGKDKFLKSLHMMKHYENYDTSVLIDDGSVLIGSSGYRHYPIRHIKQGDNDIVIEGNIYNLSDTEITSNLSTMSLDKSGLKEDIHKFITKAQGEFIVIIYNRIKRTLLIFNDALGRLPAYVYSSSQMVLFSREIKFIIPFLNKVTFDRDALAEYLIFRFALENRTLIQDIHRFPPAGMLSVNLNEQIESRQQIMSWNLDPEIRDYKDIKSITTNLVSVYRDSIQQMSEYSANKTALVSLSGGYDSRTVLAGFSEVSRKPIAFTFVNASYEYELPYAKQIARVLDVEHIIIPVPNPEEYDIKHMQWLAYLKDGLNSVNHFPPLEFAQVIRNRFDGELIEFSGEGGDQILAPLGYNFRIKHLKQLMQYIYLRDRCFSIEEASLLLDIDKKKIVDSFESILSSYPENTLEGKLKHHKIFGRAFKWSFEGECRDRFVFWHTTPFYSLNFFIEAMKLPESMKKGRSFYRLFLATLNDKCSTVKYLRPRMYHLLHRLSVELPVPILAALSKLLSRDMLWRSKVGSAYFGDILTEIMDRSSLVHEYFNLQNMKSMLKKEASQEKLLILLTILIYMDIIEGNVDVNSLREVGNVNPTA